MVLYAETISFSVTGLVPSASDGTASSELAHAHRARAARPSRALLLHELGGDAIARVNQRVTQRHRPAAGRFRVGRPPDRMPAQWNGDIPVDEGIARPCAIREGRAVEEGLEGRTGLAPGLLHMIERHFAEIAAADPGLDVAVARIDRDEARTDLRLAPAQRADECRIRRASSARPGPSAPVARGAVLRRLPHEGWNSSLPGQHPVRSSHASLAIAQLIGLPGPSPA